MNDEGQTPRFADLSVTFLGLTKAKAAGIFGALALISVNLVVFFLVAHVQANRAAVARNERALRYTCSTTRVLAGLVGFVVAQNKAALHNKSLHLSKAQVTALNGTVARFNLASAQLKANGACREIARRR